MEFVGNITPGNSSEIRQIVGMNPLLVFWTFACCLVSAIIIVVNGLYIACFYINRNKDWFNQTKNIVTIVIVDFTVGLTSLFLLVIVSQQNVDSRLCVFAQTTGLSSQITASVNLLRICITRVYVMTRNKPSPSTRAVLVQTFLCFVFSFTIVYLPMNMFTELPPVMRTCTWSKLFGKRLGFIDKYMLTVMGVPTASTTLLYVVLCMLIVEKHRQIQPINRLTGTISGNMEMSSNTETVDHTIDMQRRSRKRVVVVVKIIGLVCLFINVAELPYLLLLTVNIYNYPARYGPDVGFFASIFLLTNSVVSPFIYSYRMSRIKVAMQSMLAPLITCCKPGRTQRQT